VRRDAYPIVAVVLLLLFGCGRNHELVELRTDGVVSWESLLADVAEFKLSTLGRSRLFSSAAAPGKTALTGESPQLFGDLDHGCYLDVKNIPGGVEATLAEMDGPGAITWMWSANPLGDLVLQIDDETEIAVPFRSILEGRFLPPSARNPFAVRTAGGFNLYFPILYRKHCRIALRAKDRKELGSVFYQIAANSICTEKMIEPFRPDSIPTRHRQVEFLARRFDSRNGATFPVRQTAIIKAGDQADILVDSGSGTIGALWISASSKADLSTLHLEAFWDGEEQPSVSAPLHMLCGISAGFEDVRAYPVSVEGASAVLHWPMPFGSGAVVRLKNRSDRDVRISSTILMVPSGSSQMRFQCALSSHSNLQSDARNIVNLAAMSGAGKIVGCVLQVESRCDKWWGEGDPIIWLDSSERPAWQGTGTEDYFGFAWCSTQEFQHPFHGQTRVKDSASERISCMYRYHILDPLVFSTMAEFNLEAWGQGEGSMDYSALVMWYLEKGE